MTYTVKRLSTKHALAGKHVTLPIGVLLALPELPDKMSVAGLFNLPAAINLLLGGPALERARTVLEPTVLAPGWSQERFLSFCASPVPPRGQPIGSHELLQLLVGADRMPYRRFMIRHYTAGRDAEGGHEAFGWRPERAHSRFLPWTKSGLPGMVSGRAALQAFDDETRLLILETAANRLGDARAFAEDALKQGGPAVLLVAGEAFVPINEYLIDVYADIIHNTPLSEAARMRKPYAIEAELWLGEGGDHLLSFDGWVRELQNRVARLESRHAALYNALREQKTSLAPYYHQATFDAEVGDIGERVGAAASEMQRLPRALNFSRESEGVYRLVRLARELSDAEGRAENLHPELKTFESRLRSGAHRGPRVLNANFADPFKGELLGPREPMVAATPYHLLVDVGPRWSKARTIVRGNAGFPEKAMPAQGDGFPVQVLLIAEDFTPRMSSAWIWVPRSSGRSVPYAAAEIPSDSAPSGRPKDGKPGPVAIPVLAPKLADAEDNTPKFVSGRLCLYYEGNLLQSARIKIRVTGSRDGVKLADKNEIRVDYALTNTLSDVEACCAPRQLSFTDSKEKSRRHPVSVNIALNDDGLGGHRIIVAGRAGSEVPAPGWAQYNPHAALPILTAARTELLNCFFTRDAGGVVSKRTSLGDNNDKPYDQFRFDLLNLCEVGAELYGMVTSQIRVEGDGSAAPLEWTRSLRAALAMSVVIQVARTVRAEYTIPWALMYDIPMPGPASFCKVVREWENGTRTDTEMRNCCRYADEPWHQQNVYCPYGFWGLKHIIEQPLSQIAMKKDGRWEPVDVVREFASSAAIDFAVAVTRDTELDSARINKHLTDLSSIPRVKLCPPSPADDTGSACQAMASPDMVYFLCHGDVDHTPPLARPFLGIGLRDGKAEHMIYVRTVQGWAEAVAMPNLSQWSKRRPFVFINGCHTTNLSPEQVLNFVTGFSYARASGVIGTEVSVKVPVAAEAAKIFLEKLFHGVPAGQALREMRWALANKGNLLGLAYTLYAMADLRTQSAAV